jgi:hypothetical protein
MVWISQAALCTTSYISIRAGVVGHTTRIHPVFVIFTCLSVVTNIMAVRIFGVTVILRYVLQDYEIAFVSIFIKM